jgi:hypothetical protein
VNRHDIGSRAKAGGDGESQPTEPIISVQMNDGVLMGKTEFQKPKLSIASDIHYFR